jgi:hypothetical protein
VVCVAYNLNKALKEEAEAEDCKKGTEN